MDDAIRDPGSPNVAAEIVLASFDHFSSLPAELRIQIWNYSFEPRIVEVSIQEHECQGVIHEHVCGTSQPFPPLFSVSKESREEALRVYQTINIYGKHSEIPFVFNPSLDTIYLNSYTGIPILTESWLGNAKVMEAAKTNAINRWAFYNRSLHILAASDQAKQIVSLAIHVEELHELFLERKQPKELRETFEKFTCLKELILVCIEEQFCMSVADLAKTMHSPEVRSELALKDRHYEQISFIDPRNGTDECTQEMIRLDGSRYIANVWRVLEKAEEAGWKKPEIKVRVGRRENGGWQTLLKVVKRLAFQRDVNVPAL